MAHDLLRGAGSWIAAALYRALTTEWMPAVSHGVCARLRRPHAAIRGARANPFSRYLASACRPQCDSPDHGMRGRRALRTNAPASSRIGAAAWVGRPLLPLLERFALRASQPTGDNSKMKWLRVSALALFTICSAFPTLHALDRQPNGVFHARRVALGAKLQGGVAVLFAAEEPVLDLCPTVRLRFLLPHRMDRARRSPDDCWRSSPCGRAPLL